jgi:CRP-like cAMP-binding protein
VPSEPADVSPAERLMALRTCAAFDALSATELWRIAGCLRPRRVEAGEVLALEGLPRSTLDLVVAGRVEVSGPAGQTTLGPRDVIGSVAELLDETPSPKVVATTSTLVLAFDRSDIEDLLEDDFAIFLGFLRGMARSVVQRRSTRDHSLTVTRADVLVGRDLPSVLIDCTVALKAMPYFARAELAALAALVERSEQLSFEPGSSLLVPGVVPERFLVMTSGSVAVEAALDSFRAGDALGLVEGLALEPVGFAATARERVSAVSIATSLLLDLVEDYPSLGLGLLRELARRSVGREPGAV